MNISHFSFLIGICIKVDMNQSALCYGMVRVIKSDFLFPSDGTSIMPCQTPK